MMSNYWRTGAQALVPVVTALAMFLPTGSLVPQSVFGVYVAFLLVAVALGWPTLYALPSPWTATALLGVVGSTVLIVELAGLGENAPVVVIPLLGLGVVGIFVRELARRDGRPAVIRSMAGTACGLVAAVLVAGGSLRETGSGPLVWSAAAAVFGGLIAGVAPELIARRSWGGQTPGSDSEPRFWQPPAFCFLGSAVAGSAVGLAYGAFIVWSIILSLVIGAILALFQSQLLSRTGRLASIGDLAFVLLPQLLVTIPVWLAVYLSAA